MNFTVGPGARTGGVALFTTPKEEQRMSALSQPIMSIITLVLVVTGAVVVIVHPETLSFQDYLTACAPLVGLVAVGRGLHENGKARR